MSEIRPAQSRPEMPRNPVDKPLKAAAHRTDTQSPQVEARQDLVKKDNHKTDKLKGANVDIKV
jgi:hypothetical protein